MAVEALSPNHRPPGRSGLCRYFEKQKENHFISISLWDRLGPGTLGRSAARLALGHTPPQATKKLHETKLAACICICCRFWTKDTKRPKNPTATSEEPQAKAGYGTCSLHTIPPEGWENIYATPPAQKVKNLPANAGDRASVPGLGRSPGEGNGYPLQYPCLENSMDRGAWQATVHEIAKSLYTNGGPTHTHARVCARTHISSWTHDSLHTRNQLGPCWRASEQGKLSLVLAPRCYRRGPDKALPEFLAWPLVIFYWLRSPRTWGLGNICNLLFFSFSIDWVHAT